jgi:hypothetical protein
VELRPAQHDDRNAARNVERIFERLDGTRFVGDQRQLRNQRLRGDEWFFGHERFFGHQRLGRFVEQRLDGQRFGNDGRLAVVQRRLVEREPLLIRL